MATSKLQELALNSIYAHFGEFEILYNYRPEWLASRSGARLEIDIYIPRLNIAVEVQGEQHYRFVEVFHTDYNGFLRQVERDDEKRRILSDLNIPLIEISSESEIQGLLDKIFTVAYVAPNTTQHPLFDLVPSGMKGAGESRRLIYEAACYEKIAASYTDEDEKSVAMARAKMCRVQAKMIADKAYYLKDQQRTK